MNTQELIAAINSMGSNGLTAFIIYQVIDFIQLAGIVGLMTWGIRTVWKVIKKEIEGDNNG